MLREKIDNGERVVDWEKIKEQLRDKLSLAEGEMKSATVIDEKGQSIPSKEREFIQWALNRVDELCMETKTKEDLGKFIGGAIQEEVQKGENLGTEEKKKKEYWIKLRAELDLEA